MQLQLETILFLLLLLTLIVTNGVAINDTNCTQYRLKFALDFNKIPGHSIGLHKVQLLGRGKSVTARVEDADVLFWLEHIYDDEDEAENMILRARYINANVSSVDFDNKFTELQKSTEANHGYPRTDGKIVTSVWAEQNFTIANTDKVKHIIWEGMPLTIMYYDDIGSSLMKAGYIYEEACVTTMEPATNSTTSATSDTSTTNSTSSMPTSVESTTSVTETLSSSTDYGTTTSTTILTTTTSTSTPSVTTTGDSETTSTAKKETSTTHGKQGQPRKRNKKRKERPFSTTADKIYTSILGVLIVLIIANLARMATQM